MMIPGAKGHWLGGSSLTQEQTDLIALPKHRKEAVLRCKSARFEVLWRISEASKKRRNSSGIFLPQHRNDYSAKSMTTRRVCTIEDQQKWGCCKNAAASFLFDKAFNGHGDGTLANALHPVRLFI